VFKVLSVAMFAFFAMGLGAMAWINITAVATVDMFILGVLNGYLGILLITGLQRSTPKEMLGRLMSMIVLANLGLMPLSQTIAGAMLHWSAAPMFLLASAMLLACAVYIGIPSMASLLTVRFIGESPENT